jgi:tetratricopeptide (TPR) repeat protein
MEKKQRLPRTPETTPVVQELFANALQHHQAGRLNEAERLYLQVLTIDPHHADSLHLLGVFAHQIGRPDMAATMIGKAITVNAGVALYHSDMGTALGALGKPDEAVTCYRNAIRLQQDFPAAHFNLGNALVKQGRLDEAAACYRDAIGLQPNFPAAHNNLGRVLGDQGCTQEAVACHREALALKPDFPEAHLNLGVALQELEQLDEAIGCYRNAIDLRPDFPDAHYNLGNALRDQGRPREAISCLRGALGLKPDYAEAYNNLGKLLAEQGQLDEAILCYREALGLTPGHSGAHNNLGTALQQQGELDGAIACYRKALDLEPDLPDGHYNLALALLARGDMAEGWKEHEWRWKTPLMISAHRDFTQPLWRGELVAGRTLLIHAEQGFGDTLQFCRYAPLASARGARVILEVPRPLVRLLRSLPWVDLVVAFGEQLPEFDLHCPMLSLPLALGTTITTIPGSASYLHADERRIEFWRKRLTAMQQRGPRVGLVWAGNPRDHSPALAATNRRRSIAPGRLAPLFDVAGVNFFSLQKSGPEAPSHFPLVNVMDEMEDFADTAALIANLDLVISVDTAVIHLAAALGKPVWMLDRFDACWRWLRGRRDSPWYPTLRLYRQPSSDDWDSVLAEITLDLRDFGC